MGFKLSNYGNLLKLMVPSCSWKTISGWTNYSCMVISHKMSENEMDNRVSKSVILNDIIVKEQWINGSWCIEQWLIHLRYILKYFERSTLVKNFSKQLNIVIILLFFLYSWVNSQVFISKLNQIRSYASSTQSNDRRPSPSTLHPWFITGFTDGQGSFSVSIIKDPVFRTGWDVQLTFQIKLHLRDLALLMDIQAHLNGIGTIRKGKDYCVFKVK